MSNNLRLDEFEPAAMSPDWLEQAPCESRGKLLKRALAAGGMVVAGGVVIAGLPKFAVSAPSPAQDAEILNFALQLEYMESAFFTQGAARGRLTGELREFAVIVRDHERAHVAFLRNALGPKARKRPTFDFGEATRDPTVFTSAAVALQDLMVAAYNGQAANLTTSAFASAAKIVSVEARHAGWIRAIAGNNPAPKATDVPKSAAEVTAAVNATKFVESG
jgi:hypothetical protein